MKLTALLCGTALMALPALAHPPQTKTMTNPAGSRTITTSPTSRTMINTEGNKTLSITKMRARRGTKVARTMTRTKKVRSDRDMDRDDMMKSHARLTKARHSKQIASKHTKMRTHHRKMR